jgi:hypothetical protein
MDLAERFRAAVTRAYVEEAATAELLPMVLAQACVAVLPVAGAGISITDELRVPLGASDEMVARAERLQTTLGEGPCLTATAHREPLSADLTTMSAQWPMFHSQLLAQTSFRSIVSFPLFSRSRRLRFGALDLYLTISEPVPDFFVRQVTSSIADPMAAVLFDGHSTSSVGGAAAQLPPWLDNDLVNNRMHVWVAVGMLVEHAGLSNPDALAALRAYAFSHDVTLDDIADQLMTERLQPQSLLA